MRRSNLIPFLRCPKCRGTQLSRIVYGLPGPAGMDAARRGDVVVGGCITTPEGPTRQCRRCGHKFLPLSREEHMGRPAHERFVE